MALNEMAETVYFTLRSAASYVFQNLPTTKKIQLHKGQVLSVQHPGDIDYFRARSDIVVECGPNGIGVHEPPPGTIHTPNARTLRMWNKSPAARQARLRQMQAPPGTRPVGQPSAYAPHPAHRQGYANPQVSALPAAAPPEGPQVVRLPGAAAAAPPPSEEPVVRVALGRVFAPAAQQAPAPSPVPAVPMHPGASLAEEPAAEPAADEEASEVGSLSTAPAPPPPTPAPPAPPPTTLPDPAYVARPLTAEAPPAARTQVTTPRPPQVIGGPPQVLGQPVQEPTGRPPSTIPSANQSSHVAALASGRAIPTADQARGRLAQSGLLADDMVSRIETPSGGDF